MLREFLKYILMLRRFFKNLFKKRSDPKRKVNPKYRIRPIASGKYSLDKFHESVGEYLCEEIVNSKEEAEKCIENLERPTVYYKSEEDC